MYAHQLLPPFLSSSVWVTKVQKSCACRTPCGDPCQLHALPATVEGGFYNLLPFDERTFQITLEGPYVQQQNLCHAQVTAYMEHLTSDLERAAHPALDAVISKVGRVSPRHAARLQ